MNKAKESLKRELKCYGTFKFISAIRLKQSMKVGSFLKVIINLFLFRSEVVHNIYAVQND